MSQFPDWLWPNSNVLSPLYKKIWEAVQENCSKTSKIHGEVLVDTNKIFPLLLTSQLSTEILGYIWSLANQKYAGQLTEQELYIVIALVALAQASYPFNSLEVLYYIHTPPIPNLNLTLLDRIVEKNEITVHVSPFESPSVNSFNINKKYGNLSEFSNKSIGLNNCLLSCNYNHFQNLKDDGSIHKSSMLYDNHNNLYSQSDIKLDTKHQTFNYTDVSDDFSDFQSAPVFNISNPNIWNIKQGSVIGSRLANHNLGVKKLNEKLKKIGLIKTSSNNEIHQAAISSLMIHNKEIKHNEPLSEFFPKCNVRNQPKTVVLKDTVIRNNDPTEIVKSNIKELANNTNKNTNKISLLPKSTYTKNIDLIYVTPLKVLKEDALQQDLISMQPAEDKYSALRELVNDSSNLPSLKPNVKTNICLTLDDFGESISAKHLEKASAIKFSNTTNSIDFLNDFHLKSKNIISDNNKSSLVKEISDTFNALTHEVSVDQQINKKQFNVVLNTEKIIQKKDTLSINSIQLDHEMSEIFTPSKCVSNLHFKSFLLSSQENKQKIEDMYQMIYWKWKNYMESCILLLQVAANIFTSIKSDIVLREVLSTAQGYNFLCNLAEVAAICRRVNFSHKEMDINIMGFDDLLMEIDRIWSDMEPFYSNIPIISELPAWPLHQGDGITCMLCMTIVTNGRVIFNNNNYHATCANLWLHAVNSKLPVLQYPFSHMYSTIFQSTHS